MRKPKRAINIALNGVDKALAEYQSSIREYHVEQLDKRGFPHEETIAEAEAVVEALLVLHHFFRICRDA